MVKIGWIILFTMVVVHIVYDWATPFAPESFHALFASSYFMTFFGYVAFRLIDDALNNPNELQRNVKWAIGSYFIYRTLLNFISFLQSFELDGSWQRYKTVTSNYYADGIIWIAIAIFLIYTIRKNKLKCRKKKTIS